VSIGEKSFSHYATRARVPLARGGGELEVNKSMCSCPGAEEKSRNVPRRPEVEKEERKDKRILCPEEG